MSEAALDPSAPKPKIPMFAKILIGVLLGVVLGLLLQSKYFVSSTLKDQAAAFSQVAAIHKAEYQSLQAQPDALLTNAAQFISSTWDGLASIKNKEVSSAGKGQADVFKELGMLVIKLLKALATPLILFAVLDAFLRTNIPAKKGLKMLLISTINAVVAIIIALLISDVLQTGKKYQGHLEEVARGLDVKIDAKSTTKTEATLDPVKNLSNYIPANLVDPFQTNNIISVVLVAVLTGAALRALKNKNRPATKRGLEILDESIHTIFCMFTVMLAWIVELLPYGVCAVVAGVVGQTGPKVFELLWPFLYTITLGMVIHSVVYYGLLLKFVGGVSPLKFFAGAWDAIVTAMSCGSSLATMPTTLVCLEQKLKVSFGASRLAACVGTNLNHAGIILYEAVACLFLAQALGIELTVSQQVTVALASIMAGVGIAGVPEAGLITLSLVLNAVGLPDYLVPLVFPVDWMIGRMRATVNVLSDMTVAQLLDKVHPEEPDGSSGTTQQSAS